MSILKQQVNFYPNFASIFIAMTHKSSVNFKLVHFLLWIKGSDQKCWDFEIFKCSAQNLKNYSCHFPNYKLVFLQILHHSSLSWKITPLYFFSSTNIYTLLKRNSLKCNFFDFPVFGPKFAKFLMSILKQQVSSSPNFASFFSAMKDNPSVIF